VEEENSPALSYAPIADDMRPVSMDARDGAHTGLLQYALTKVTPWSARRLRFGVRTCDLPYIGSTLAVSWSAWMTRMLGRVVSVMRWVLRRASVPGFNRS